MNQKNTGLEDFVERHRADFDAFEPRPDLWDDLEAQLSAPVALAAAHADPAAPAPLRVVKLHPAEAADASAARRAAWLPRPSIAAAVGLLVLAGAGAIWSNGHRPASAWTATPATPRIFAPLAAAEPAADARPYFGASTVADAEHPAQRLGASVQRMEAYYAAQIEERQRELEQLEAESAPASLPADWQHELANLDSTYRQLKLELYRNPEPEVVLEAMNRNLQNRLDLLNQQTRTREQIQEYHTRPLMIADTHPQP